MTTATTSSYPRPGTGTTLASLRSARQQEQAAQAAQDAPAVRPVVEISLNTVQGFEGMQRIADLFCHSTIVPDAFRGNIANCVVALNIAYREKMDPLMVMQNMYIVHGKPAWASAFLIAMFNKCGKFAPIQYEFAGKPGTPQYGCRALTVDLTTGRQIDGPLVTMQMAQAEGWTQRNPKWTTMPDLMFRYRAAAFLIRTQAPEITMGFYSVEEQTEIYEQERRRHSSSVREVVTRAEAATSTPARAPEPEEALPEQRKPDAVVSDSHAPAEKEEVKPSAPKAAAKPEPQPAQAKKGPGEKIKCPDTGKMVDDVADCPNCPHRKGCPQWD